MGDDPLLRLGILREPTLEEQLLASQIQIKAAAEIAQRLAAARRQTDRHPSEAQQEAGNYAKGKLPWKGLVIAVENPKGSVRSGTGKDGKAWSITMACDYGYFLGSTGKDKDHVDVFLGPLPECELVYVVNQVDPATGKFDEHKVLLGFTDETSARAGYLANYEDGWGGLGSIKAMTLDTFKGWLTAGPRTKQAEENDNGVSQRTVPVAAGDKQGGVSGGAEEAAGVPGVPGALPAGAGQALQPADAADASAGGGSRDEPRATVAVDLDGTLARNREPFDPGVIGDPRPGAKKWMEAFRQAGARLVIFTVRGDKELVRTWLTRHQIPFDYINENPDQPPDSSGKVIADFYLDDRAVNAAGPWSQVGQDIMDRMDKMAGTLACFSDPENLLELLQLMRYETSE